MQLRYDIVLACFLAYCFFIIKFNTNFSISIFESEILLKIPTRENFEQNFVGLSRCILLKPQKNSNRVRLSLLINLRD